MENGPPRASKIEPKSYNFSSKKVLYFSTEKCTHFCWKLAPGGVDRWASKKVLDRPGDRFGASVENGASTDTKIGFRVPFSAPERISDGKWTPKGVQNGAKKHLWTQIGGIGTSLSSQRDLEIGSRDLEVV